VATPELTDSAAERRHAEGLRFARRVHGPRVVGLALGFLCIAGGLWQQAAPGLAYVALALNSFAWPHVALHWATRSVNPHRAELRNLVVDSASGGFWIGYLGFNLVPTAVLVAMLAMDKAVVGGPRLLARCLVAQALAALAGAAAAGFAVRLHSDIPTILASLPLLLAYPIAVGFTAHRLARRVREQTQLLETLSSTDGLTGLLNRMYWEAAVAAELGRCKRSGDRAALMMVDIDHFKSVNDTHGHAAGDEVIRAVGEILRGTLRVHDLPGRYGGEEFAVVMPSTDAAGAAALAERIRAKVEGAVLERGHGVRRTVSIGFAALAPTDASPEEWIERADRALYRAKEAGRNRVEEG
jgi:diguanylate cyclase